jgi:hypothetical protein
MSELVGRFLSFEDHLGRGLVKFVYYVLLFLLVVTTLFELVTALIAMFSGAFWPSLWAFLVLVPLNFFVRLLLLRVGAELVIAILSIDDNLRGESSPDTMSTGLNPVTPPRAAPTMTAPIPRNETAEDEAEDHGPVAGSTSEKRAEEADEDTRARAQAAKPARKRTSRKASKKTAKKSVSSAPQTKTSSNASSSGAAAPEKDAPKPSSPPQPAGPESEEKS